VWKKRYRGIVRGSLSLGLFLRQSDKRERNQGAQLGADDQISDALVKLPYHLRFRKLSLQLHHFGFGSDTRAAELYPIINYS